MQKYFLSIVFLLLCNITRLPAQNVGIGISTPTRAKLELNGMVGNTTAIFGSDANGIGLVANWPQLEYNGYFNTAHRYINNGFAAMQYLNPGTGFMVFDVTASGLKDAPMTGVKTALSFAPTGRVGIGQNSGFDAQLNVGRDAGMDGSAYFPATQWSAFNYGSNENTYIRSPIALNKLYVNYNVLNSKIVIGSGSSLVGLNWASPVYPLEIHSFNYGIGIMRLGSLNHWIMSVNQNYLKLFFRSTTADNAITQLGVFDYTNGQYSASSDRRIKKQIEPLPPTLAKIMELRAYQYEMIYNNPGHDETIGLIAQEVKEIFPSLVHATKDANTGYKDIKDVHTMNYSGLAPIIIKALQEQQAQLKELEERIVRLEKD